MSRKHFKAAAAILSNYSDVTGPAKSIVREIANEFADLFADENPRFDRERFLAACGL